MPALTKRFSAVFPTMMISTPERENCTERREWAGGRDAPGLPSSAAGVGGVGRKVRPGPEGLAAKAEGRQAAKEDQAAHQNLVRT